MFKAFPTTPINIDIKVDDDELITKVGEFIFLSRNIERACLIVIIALYNYFMRKFGEIVQIIQNS